jgi:hypothetical protein
MVEMKLSPRLILIIVLSLSFILNNIWAAGGPDWLYLVSRLLFDFVLLAGCCVMVIIPPFAKQWVGNDVKQKTLLRLFGIIFLLIFSRNIWALFKAPMGK